MERVRTLMHASDCHGGRVGHEEWMCQCQKRQDASNVCRIVEDKDIAVLPAQGGFRYWSSNIARTEVIGVAWTRKLITLDPLTLKGPRSNIR